MQKKISIVFHFFILFVISSLLSSCQCDCNQKEAPLEQKWTWTKERFQAATKEVTAGKDLTPKVWPNNGKVAVLLSFDVDNETIAWWDGEPTATNLSKGEYGARVGLKRVVNLLDKYKLPASFFIPALSLDLHPEMADEIKRLPRHEFAVHGWIHERNYRVPPAREREMVEESIRILTEITGEKPVGYRAPSWNFSKETPQILMDLGFMYESSMMADDRPYELVLKGQPSGIVELPVEWILDDAPLLNPLGNRYSNPRDLLQVWKDEFDVAYAEGTMFLLTMHPHYIGHRSRIVILEELIKHIQSKENIWFGTHQEAAEFVRVGL